MTGKTYMMKWILSLVHRSYNAILVFSPTAALQRDNYDWIDERCIIKNFDSDSLSGVVEKQREYRDSDGRPTSRMLIILDDCDYDQTRSEDLSTLFTSGRHIGISIMCIAQTHNQLSTIVKKNLDAVIYTKVTGYDVNVIRNMQSIPMSEREYFKYLSRIINQREHVCVCVYFIGKDNEPFQIEAPGKIHEFEFKPVRPRDD
jgi:hypothetical protein